MLVVATAPTSPYETSIPTTVTTPALASPYEILMLVVVITFASPYKALMFAPISLYKSSMHVAPTWCTSS